MTYNIIDNVVKSMRQVREELSEEIKDMTFEEERAFLDKLLQKEAAKTITNKNETNNPV